MTTQDVMTYVYPLLAAAAFMLVLILCIYHLYVRRILIFVPILGYFLMEFSTFAILALVTGHAPLADFNILRPWLVGVRVLMLLFLVWMTYSLVVIFAKNQRGAQ